MRVLIAGIDGYLGWPLALALAARGHELAGVDLFLRRRWVEEMGSHSAIPIASMHERLAAYREHFGAALWFREGDLRAPGFVRRVLAEFQPEAVVHLGEMPSAPYSMIDVDHAVFTQTNNIVSTLNLLFALRDTCPDTHLVKLGTMGEYGTPNLDIPEGFFEIEYRGRRDRLPFPRQAGSWYHLSKVHDSHNIMFACRTWQLRSTDVMQGIVYGTRTRQITSDARLGTRLDFDEAFGTVINRFCCQAVIGHPITLYGAAQRQRGFLPLRDSIQCLTLAIEHPPATGEYRVFNQLEAVYNLCQLAERVQRIGGEFGLAADIRRLDNPRVEAEAHYYNPDHQHLLDLGYRPTHDMDTELRVLLADLLPQRQRIVAKQAALVPGIHWDGRRRAARAVDEAVPGPAARRRQAS
ncbi:MAG: NAD-dependent epimerase/dehydratase family protein [Deltaproteobacteria bacterium]|nr:NAD-dependent epimerase/dehydratase family protein [Deltaproteobacteria bacterium]